MNEAAVLRNAGFQSPILLFDDSRSYGADKYIDLDVRASVNSMEDAEYFSSSAEECGKKLKIHIKIDTGMGRLGFLADGLTSGRGEPPLFEQIKKISQLPNIEIEGIYSHFANADTKDKTHAKQQLTMFKKLTDELKTLPGRKPILHIANSAAIMEIPGSHFDMVRPGIILYGLYPSDEVDRSIIDLKPVMSLKSHIVHLKTVGPGFRVSYGSTYITEKESVIATVPAGYADGISRLLSSNGFMLVRGKRAPIIGRVCMDLTMIDVTGISGVSIHDEVVLIGKQGEEEITADEIAVRTGTINYEVVTSLAPRVPKKMINRSV
jgi:alanine racemase